MEKINPTAVPIVIENIASHLDSRKLLVIRRISKEWNEVIKSILRKRLDISLELNGAIKRNLRFLKHLREFSNAFVAPVMKLDGPGSHKRTRIIHGYQHTFLQVAEQICELLGSQNQIRKLVISFSYNTLPNTAELLHKILRHLSTSLKVLDLYQIKDISNFVLNSTTTLNFPSLLSLNLENTLEIQSNNQSVKISDFHSWLRMIFNSSPNLKEISGDCRILKNYNLIPLLHETGKLPYMEKLIMDFSPLNMEILETVSHQMLRALSVFIPNGTYTPASFHKLCNFIQKNSKTLEELELHADIKSTGFPLNEYGKPELILGSLPLLWRLETNTDGDLEFLDINYATDTPKLRSLNVNVDMEVMQPRNTVVKEFTCDTLTDLSTNLQFEDFKMFLKFGKRFPNVRKFNWGFSAPKNVQILSEMFPKLEELTLDFHTGNHAHPVTYLDNFLFGVDDEDRKLLDFKRADWLEHFDTSKGLRRDLFKLKISVCSEFLGEEMVLSDFAIYCGFGQMRNLRSLTIDGGDIVTVKVRKKHRKYLIASLPNLEKFVIESKNYKK